MKRFPIEAAAVFAALLAVAPRPSIAAPEELSAGGNAQAQAAMTPEGLDLMLAPIALYPDQLLAQMLMSAANPKRVGDLEAWLKKNPSLKGSALQDAAQKAGFEPSFVALAPFPQVVTLMAGDPGWTAQLGQAFATDRRGVVDSIQRLRAQSKEVGQLKTTPQQTVDMRTTESGQQVIVIEPANPQVVYVPQYNPQVVYTQPPPSTTVVVQQESNTGAAVAGSVVGFAAGVAIGAAIDNDYYYGPYGWRAGPYMYNDAWDDWYDDREDAREDWYDHREDAREDYQENRQDLAQERSERAGTQQQQRTERQTQAQGTAQQARSTSAGATASSYESRGYTRTEGATRTDRSGTRSDAFSGYSSGKSERAASSRGQRSRSSSGGGRSRRR